MSSFSKKDLPKAYTLCYSKKLHISNTLMNTFKKQVIYTETIIA